MRVPRYISMVLLSTFETVKFFRSDDLLLISEEIFNEILRFTWNFWRTFSKTYDVSKHEQSSRLSIIGTQFVQICSIEISSIYLDIHPHFKLISSIIFFGVLFNQYLFLSFQNELKNVESNESVFWKLSQHLFESRV